MPTEPAPRRSLPLLLGIGVAGGFVSGLLGLGGAFVFIPPMIGCLGMERHRAHATTLAVMFFTSLTAVTESLRIPGFLTGPLVAFPAWGALLGAVLGTRIMMRLSGRWLGILFSGFLVLAAVALVGLRVHASPALLRSPVAIDGATTLIGIVAGIVSGSLGVGSGALVTPLVMAAVGTSQLTAQAVALTVVSSVSLVGGVIHWVRGTLDRAVWGWVTIGGMAGAMAGVDLAIHVPPLILHWTLIGALLAIGSAQLRTAVVAPKGVY